MIYTKFTIENYKGIPGIQLDFTTKPQHNIFTLVGLNESGKTSILEAIDLFFKGIDKESAHLMIPKNKKHSFSGDIKFTAEILLNQKEINAIKNNLAEKGFIMSEFDGKLTINKVYSFENQSLQNQTGTLPLI